MPFIRVPGGGPARPPVFVRSRTRPTPVPTDPGEIPEESTERASVVPPTKRKHYKVDRSGPNWDDDGEFIVGKGRPPKAAQWQPKQSGNPRGPKRKEKIDPETALDNAILDPFKTTVNGMTVEVNLGLFSLQILKTLASQKNRKAAADLLNLYVDTMRARRSQQSIETISPEEQALINNLLDTAGWEAMPPIRNRHMSVADDEESGDE